MKNFHLDMSLTPRASPVACVIERNKGIRVPQTGAHIFDERWITPPNETVKSWSWVSLERLQWRLGMGLSVVLLLVQQWHVVYFSGTDRSEIEIAQKHNFPIEKFLRCLTCTKMFIYVATPCVFRFQKKIKPHHHTDHMRCCLMFEYF